MVKLSGRVEIAQHCLGCLLRLHIAPVSGEVLQEFLQRGALVHNAVMAGMQHIQRIIKTGCGCFGFQVVHGLFFRSGEFVGYCRR